jgi:hypothetical protein
VIHWPYFFSLTRQVVDGIGWAWPISLFLLLCVAAAVLQKRGNLRACLRPGWAWQLVVILNPIAIAFLGTAYVCENCSPSSLGLGVRHFWAMRLADALLLAQLLAMAWWAWRSKPCRLFIAALHLLFFWCTLWAAFIAGMSMSGDWL